MFTLGIDFGMNTTNDYSFYAFKKLRLKEESYEEHCFGLSLGSGYYLADIYKKTSPNATVKEVEDVGFILKYFPIFYYDVVHASLIYTNDKTNVFFGLNWKLNLIPSHLVLSAHYKKNKHLVQIGIQKNIWTVFLSFMLIGIFQAFL